MKTSGKTILKRIARKIEIILFVLQGEECRELPGSLYIKTTGRDGTELLQILIVSILIDQGSDAASGHESGAANKEVSRAFASFLSLEAS